MSKITSYFGKSLSGISNLQPQVLVPLTQSVANLLESGSQVFNNLVVLSGTLDGECYAINSN
jgi:hypothetical protein